MSGPRPVAHDSGFAFPRAPGDHGSTARQRAVAVIVAERVPDVVLKGMLESRFIRRTYFRFYWPRSQAVGGQSSSP